VNSGDLCAVEATGQNSCGLSPVSESVKALLPHHRQAIAGLVVVGWTENKYSDRRARDDCGAPGDLDPESRTDFPTGTDVNGAPVSRGGRGERCEKTRPAMAAPRWTSPFLSGI